MAVRTTRANMELILDIGNTITDAQVTAFITTANELVTEYCTASSYTATRLELIERWLACHFLQILEQPIASEKAGSVAASYRGKAELNLGLTHYGQQAMLLDTAGGLAALNERTKKGKSGTVGVVHLGWTRDDQRVI